MELLDALFRRMVSYYAGDPMRIQHFTKVHGFARLIGTLEGLSPDPLFTLEAAALVHDIGIRPAEAKYGSSAGPLQEREGPPVARAMLEELGFPRETVERVCFLVGHHHTYDAIDGPDYQILVEADFLVNLYEDNLGEEAVRSALDRIFRTETGSALCREMYRPASR